jgi:hypothetical protein
MSPSSRLKFSQRTVRQSAVYASCVTFALRHSLYVTYSFKEMRFRSNDISQLYETDCLHWL